MDKPRRFEFANPSRFSASSEPERPGSTSGPKNVTMVVEPDGVRVTAQGLRSTCRARAVADRSSRGAPLAELPLSALAEPESLTVAPLPGRPGTEFSSLPEIKSLRGLPEPATTHSAVTTGIFVNVLRATVVRCRLA